MPLCPTLLPLHKTTPTFCNPDKEAFENIMGKGGNAVNHIVLPLTNASTLYQTT